MVDDVGRVRICPTDDGVRYAFDVIRRPGWRQNGLGAFVVGVITLAGAVAIIWFVDNRAAMDPASIMLKVLYWIFCVIGVASSLPFFACFVYTILRGGRAWLSLSGGVVHVGYFFGGALANHYIRAEDITDVLVEPLQSAWDGIERGRIRLVGANIRLAEINTGEVEAGSGYPVSELSRVAEDLRQRLNLKSHLMK